LYVTFSRSPPRLSLGDMEDSIVKEKSQRISELESEIEDLTAKVVKAENHFEQQKSLAETLSKEVSGLMILVICYEVI